LTLLCGTGCIDWDEALLGVCPTEQECPDAQRHVFSKALGGLGLESVVALAVTRSGDSVVGGFYTGASAMDGPALSEFGATDLFLARFDPEGDHLWSLGVGGLEDEQVRAISEDSFGEQYVAGDFASAALVFPGTSPLARQGDRDGFLIRVSPEGTVRWSVGLGAAGAQVRSRSVVTAPDAASVVVAGTFTGSINFAGDVAASSATEGVFLVRISESGAALKTVALGTCSAGSLSEPAVGIDTQKNLYFVGTYQGTCTVAGHALTPPPASQAALFAVKTNFEGTLIWGVSFSEMDNTGRIAVAVDKKDHLLVTGSFKGQATFPELDPLESRTRATSDAFLLKLNRENGAVLWATSEGGTGNDEGVAVAVDSENNPSFTGSFEGRFTSNAGDQLESAGSTDVFLSQYTEVGDTVETLVYGDELAQSGRALGVDEDGFVLAGQFLGTLKFSPTPLTARGTDIFFARLRTSLP